MNALKKENVSARVAKCLFRVAVWAMTLWAVRFAGRQEALFAEESATNAKANTKYAILVGVDDYLHLPALSCAVADATAIRDQLEKVGFPSQNIYTLTSTSRLAQRPSKANCEKLLDRILGVPEHQDANDSSRLVPAVPGLAGRDDLVFIALIGHGLELNGDARFCPEETDDTDNAACAETTLSIGGIVARLEASPARFKLMLVDACRKMTSRRGVASGVKQLETLAAPPPGVVLLQSCSRGESSYEDKEQLGHGVFTNFFVEALSGKALAPGKDAITFHDIVDYTDQKTREYVMRRWNEYQRPYMNGNSGNFIFADGLMPPAWIEAEELYREACQLRKERKYKEALEKIQAARRKNAEKREYGEEEETISEWLGMVTKAKVMELYSQALREYNGGEYKDALASIAGALELEPLNADYLSLRKTIRKAMQPERFTNSQGQVFKLIPAGEFMMGDTLTPEEVDKKFPGGELAWYQDAHPRHKVRISEPFYMGIHEVTVGEFRSFVGSTNYETTAEKEGTARGYNKETKKWEDIKGLNWRSPGIEQESTHPVTCVSWDDAQEYIKWLNGQEGERPAGLEGYRYALPTEAQWEYACRAGSTTTFFWGDDQDGGNGKLNAAGEDETPWGTTWNYHFPFKDGYPGTSPVGSFSPNNWGLCDMLGNVWEWCSDRYDSDYYAHSPDTDPTGPESGSLRVIRGGSWSGYARDCRSANRGGGVPGNRDSILGFRLALVPGK